MIFASENLTRDPESGAAGTFPVNNSLLSKTVLFNNFLLTKTPIYLWLWIPIGKTHGSQNSLVYVYCIVGCHNFPNSHENLLSKNM